MKFKSENHKKHYEAWMLQSEHPEWEGKRQNQLFKESICYACDEDYKLKKNRRDILPCECCPTDWDGGDCLSKNSIYLAWRDEKDPELRSIMAEVIALKEWRIKK